MPLKAQSKQKPKLIFDLTKVREHEERRTADEFFDPEFESEKRLNREHEAQPRRKHSGHSQEP